MTFDDPFKELGYTLSPYMTPSPRRVVPYETGSFAHVQKIMGEFKDALNDYLRKSITLFDKVSVGDILISEQAFDYTVRICVELWYDPSLPKEGLELITSYARMWFDTNVVGRACAFQHFDLEFRATPRVKPFASFNLADLFRKEYDMNYIVPKPVEIIHKTSKRGEFFTVKWDDNTTTTVKRMEGDVSDEYTAYLYALGKKLYGDKGAARQVIKTAKKNFEDRLDKAAAHKKAEREKQKLEQSLAAENFHDKEFAQSVYDRGFVPPCAFGRKTAPKKRGPFKKQRTTEEQEAVEEVSRYEE